MDHVGPYKLKNVVLKVRKLDMLWKTSDARNRKDSEEPNSDNISTKSMETDVVRSGEVEFKKKRKSHSITEKKDEKSSVRNGSEIAKMSKYKHVIDKKHIENSKSCRKSLSTFKSEVKLNEKHASSANISCKSSKRTEEVSYMDVETESNCNEKKRKKEKINKSIVGNISVKEKASIPGNGVGLKEQQTIYEKRKSGSSNTRDVVKNVIKSSDKRNEEEIISTVKKSRKDEFGSIWNLGAETSEVLEKRNLQGKDKKYNKHSKRKYKKLLNEKSDTESDSVGKKYRKSTDIKMISDVSKTKSSSSSSSSPRVNDNDYSKVKRSTRISSMCSHLKDFEKNCKEQKKSERYISLAVAEKKAKSRDLAQESVINSKETSDKSKLKTDIKTESNKKIGRGKEKMTGIATQKSRTEHPIEQKLKNDKDQLNTLNIKKLRSLKHTSVTSREENDLNANAPKKLQKKGKSYN